MTGKFEDRLGGYTQVKDRIRLFYEAHHDGRLVTAEVRWPHPDDDPQRIAVRALAYRTPDDPHPAVGWSWMLLPGTTNFTRGSELENTETSAWGRAIGALGIGIGDSIATSDEIDAKAGEEERARPAAGETAPTPESGLIGTIDVKAEWLTDLQLRQTPEGPVIGFRLKQGRQSIKVQAHGPMATGLATFGDELAGMTVTCWGTLIGEEFTPKGTTRPVTYQVLRLERITGPTFAFPADVDPKRFTDGEPAPVHPDNIPLFDADEDAAIAEALGVTKA
jgi:hypothetical protein